MDNVGDSKKKGGFPWLEMDDSVWPFFFVQDKYILCKFPAFLPSLRMTLCFELSSDWRRTPDSV